MTSLPLQLDPQRHVALDMGARQIVFCEVREGRVVARKTVSDWRELEPMLGPHTERARVAVEACREAWFITERLEEWGHEALLVDTTRVRQLGLGQHGRKNDRIDAEVLARAVERGHIPQAWRLSFDRQQLRMQLSVRHALVETRAQYVTTVRGLARAWGQPLPSCCVKDFVTKVRETELSEPLRALIEPLCELLEPLNVKITQLDEQLYAAYEKQPEMQRLTTVPGVGLIVAAAFVSVIDEAKRFRNAHQVESYLGLVPSEDTTGGRRRLGSITKQGNAYVRTLLVQAAWGLVRSAGDDDPLKSWFLQVEARRGKNVAITALARRLAGVLWALWKKASVYDPARLLMQSAIGVLQHVETLEQHALALEQAAKKVAPRRTTKTRSTNRHSVRRTQKEAAVAAR